MSQGTIDKTLVTAHPNSPYVAPTSIGRVRKGIIQQHGFVTPNSAFNQYLDRDKVRLLNAYERNIISEKLPLKTMQPTAEREREFLVPLGALQAKYSRHPNILRVPGGVIRQGSVQVEASPTQDVDVSEERIRILKFIEDALAEGDVFEGK